MISVNNPATPVRSLWWKVRDRPVHFLASMHLGPMGGFSHGSAIMDAFDAAETVHFEVTRDEMSAVPDLVRREHGTLGGDLGPELYQRLLQDPRYEQHFEGLKLPFVVTQLAAHAYTEIGLSHQCGVESILYARAAANGQRIGGLEAAADQVRGLVSLGTDLVANGLRNVLDHPNLITEARDLIVLGYIQGDEVAMNTARAKMYETYPDVANRILTAREARWSPLLHAIITEGRPAMVVVGALHLAGDSILAALRRDGFIIDRMGP